MRQWHAAMHLGIRKAKAEACGPCACCGWLGPRGRRDELARHGRSTQLLQQKKEGVDAAQKQGRVKFVMSWMHASRTCPSLAFHLVWHSVLRLMHGKCARHAAAAALRDHYLCEEARDQVKACGSSLLGGGRGTMAYDVAGELAQIGVETCDPRPRAAHAYSPCRRPANHSGLTATVLAAGRSSLARLPWVEQLRLPDLLVLSRYPRATTWRLGPSLASSLV